MQVQTSLITLEIFFPFGELPNVGSAWKGEGINKYALIMRMNGVQVLQSEERGKIQKMMSYVEVPLGGFHI